MKKVKTIWFTAHGGLTIGVVLTKDETTGIHKAYVGAGGGVSETLDEAAIMAYGAKFTKGMAQEILDHLNKK